MIFPNLTLRHVCCGVAAVAMLTTGDLLVGRHGGAGGLAFAQPTTQPAPPPGNGPTTQPGRGQRGQRGGQRRSIATMVTRYHDVVYQLDGITDDQKAKLDPIFDKAKTDADALNKELQGMAPEDRRERSQEFFEDLRGKVNEVLTDDQRNELADKMQNMRPAGGGRGQGGGGQGAPGGGQGGLGGPGTPAPPPPPPGGGPGTRPGDGGGGGNGGGNAMNNSSQSAVLADAAVSSNAAVAFAAAPIGAAAGGSAIAAMPRLDRFLQRFNAALAQIDLTPQQKTQVQATIEQLKAQVAAMGPQIEKARANPADREAVRARVQTLLASTRQQIVAELTSEQVAKLREILATSSPANGAPSNRKSALIAAGGPDVGQAAPDFALQTVDGKTAKLADFSGKTLVLVFGCMTDPSFRDNAAGLTKLAADYGGRASFLVVYRSELHPEGGWEVQRNHADGIAVQQQADVAARLAAAKQAQSKLGLTVPIVLDAMDNQVAGAYGAGESDAAVVIDGMGQVVYRQNNFQPEGLSNALQGMR